MYCINLCREVNIDEFQHLLSRSRLVYSVDRAPAEGTLATIRHHIGWKSTRQGYPGRCISRSATTNTSRTVEGNQCHKSCMSNTRKQFASEPASKQASKQTDSNKQASKQASKKANKRQGEPRERHRQFVLNSQGFSVFEVCRQTCGNCLFVFHAVAHAVVVCLW